MKDSNAPLLCCAKEGCPKKIHTLCYQELVFKPQKSNDEKKGNVTNLLGEDQVACDGKHHTSAANAIKKQAEGISSVSWHNDGKNGVDDPNSSLKILLDWLTVESNFQKYRGDNKTGLTKSRICADLAKAMNEAGVRNPRDGPSVRAKIGCMEANFKKAYDWAGNTGVGVREEQGEETFNAVLLKSCPEHFMLLPLMANRSSINAAGNSDDAISTLALTSTLGHDVDEEEEEEEDDKKANTKRNKQRESK